MSLPLEHIWVLAQRLGMSHEAFAALKLPRIDEPPVDLEGLILAAACLAHLPAALQMLDEQLLPSVRDTLRRRATPSVVDDVLQQTRIKLLLGTPPALAQYAGKGPLQSFLRTVALRLLSNLEATQKPFESDETLAAVPDVAEIEAGLVRGDQQIHFRHAFREAVTALTPKERALLRLSLLDHLSIDEIAPLYQAHRSTIARWLTEARQTLAEQTRTALARRLGLEGEALESLLRSVQHRFDLSLTSALRESQSRNESE